MKRQFIIACLCAISISLAHPSQAQQAKKTTAKPVATQQTKKPVAKPVQAQKQTTKPVNAEPQPSTTPAGTMATTSKATENTAATPTETKVTPTKKATPNETGYEKGNLLLNAGLSFGVIGYNYGGYGSASGFLPITVNAEYSLTDQFAVGGYVGFYSRKYSYLSNYRFSAVSFGARGTFHGTALLNDALDANMDVEKLDLYASVIIGYQSVSWKYDGSTSYFTNDSHPVFGPTLGIRYMFTPKIGGYFEGGRGAFGFGTIGISAKF